MGMDPGILRDTILARIRASLERAEQGSDRLRRRNSRFVSVSILAGALGTAVTASAATVGPIAGQGPGAWKVTCAASAVLTACATVFSGLNQQLSVPDRLARATACVGRLRALEIELTMTNRDPAGAAREYEEVVASYQEFIS